MFYILQVQAEVMIIILVILFTVKKRILITAGIQVPGVHIIWNMTAAATEYINTLLPATVHSYDSEHVLLMVALKQNIIHHLLTI